MVNPKLPAADRDHIQGPIDASITLVEYGDYECPYCGQAYAIVADIQKELGKRLCFAFRNFPLSNVHPHAKHAAEAAAAQGSFWEMHDMLFENQGALDDASLAEYAAALELDAPRLMREVLAGAYSDRVREDFLMGARASVNGTPTLFVNGIRYDGELNTDDVLAALSAGGGPSRPRSAARKGKRKV